MSDVETTRRQVSETYADAVTRTGGCCDGPATKGVAARFAGYEESELRDLPPEAVANSFGCGNPVALADLKPGDVVLDLGSGAGIDLLLAAKKVGSTGHVIGIDMTDEMIAKARENIAASGLANVEARKGLIEDLPVDSESVDWVISNCVINLSPEKDKVFAEIARVLKPGGRMSVSDLVVEDLPDWVRADPVLYSSCVGGAIGEDDYLHGLRDAGLDEVHVADRLTYEATQISAIVDSDVFDAGSGCCGQRSTDVLEALAGKVSSVRFVAAKPRAGDTSTDG
ncbi:ubiquinone/menaquinone biosynthesis C-methyltransferase UbiE [bacterium BMS3Abin02]|nr:ubiquinone/menaquinone biosynthesis C-methyltransferase UbiE [bacterium BMS3Abin02]HDK45486.1 arsenite methyltransferase [Actinomycetota bacterium]